MRNTYLRVDKGRRALTLLRGMEDPDIIMDGTGQLNMRPHDAEKLPPLTDIPAVANLPMERPSGP